MRIIEGQVIATTNLDEHGEKLAPEELLKLFEQISDPMILTADHSYGDPPAGKGFNKQFIQLEDGAYAIKMDVEVWDESRFAKWNGFSISFSTGYLTRFPKRLPDLEILLNTIHYEQSVYGDLVEYSSEDLNINAVMFKQKAVEPTAIAILKFATVAIATGFLNQIGSDIYTGLRKYLASLPFKTKGGSVGAIQILAPFEKWNISYEVIIELSATDPISYEQQMVNLKSARKFIDTRIGDHTGISRIVIKNHPEAPFWQVKCFTDSEGRVVDL